MPRYIYMAGAVFMSTKRGTDQVFGSGIDLVFFCKVDVGGEQWHNIGVDKINRISQITLF